MKAAFSRSGGPRWAHVAIALLAGAGVTYAGIPDPMPQGTHASSRARQIDTPAGQSADSGFIDASQIGGPTSTFATRSLGDSTITVDTTSEYGRLTNDITFVGPLSSNTNASRLVQGFSESGFQDNVVSLTGPGLTNGDIVTMTASFALDIDPLLLFAENISGPGFGFQRYSYEFAIDIAGAIVEFEGTFLNEGLGTELIDGVASPGIVEVEFTVPVGQEFSIGATLDSAYFGSVSNASFNADASIVNPEGHFRWLGIEGVPEGAVVASEFFSYSTPIPTPASGALAGAGLVLGFSRRRRR